MLPGNEVISSIELRYPSVLITNELDGVYGSAVLQDLKKIIHYYDVYDKGADFIAEGSNNNYVPADLKINFIKQIIDKESRFMFSRMPDVTITPVVTSDATLAQTSIIQNYINMLLKKNFFGRKLMQAARDCFIGERVVLVANFNETGTVINFIRSLEFIYDVSENDTDEMIKLVIFYSLQEAKLKEEQRIYKKKYWMENGKCHITEKIYNGLGEEIQTIYDNLITEFEFIPAVVIVNEGLSGDITGDSEVHLLENNNSWYNRLTSGDIDAERQSMNPIRYTKDMSPDSTKNLSIAAGAYWDLHTDIAAGEGTAGDVGVVEATLAYNTSLEKTLNRIKNDSFELVDMPNIADLQGKMESGKALKSVYWGLIVRCDEKMLSWKNAIEFIVNTLILGAKLYPEFVSKYTKQPIPEVEYDIEVEGYYALPEDEEAEKTMDLLEVTAQTMSKKTYMTKWQRLTADEADLELQQIADERQLLENSYTNPQPIVVDDLNNETEV